MYVTKLMFDESSQLIIQQSFIWRNELLRKTVLKVNLRVILNTLLSLETLRRSAWSSTGVQTKWNIYKKRFNVILKINFNGADIRYIMNTSQSLIILSINWVKFCLTTENNVEQQSNTVNTNIVELLNYGTFHDTITNIDCNLACYNALLHFDTVVCFVKLPV